MTTTMNTFRFLDPDLHEQSFGATTSESSIHEALFNASSLADSARMLFTGLYPVETPHSPWDKTRHLPWSDQYYSLDASDRIYFPRPICSEVSRLAGLLGPAGVHADNAGDSNGFGMTYAIEAFAGDMLTMQGLAVEVMIAVDDTVWHLSESRPVDAMTAISFAYQNIIECTVKAEMILDGRRGAGRIAPQALPPSDRSARFCIGPVQ